MELDNRTRILRFCYLGSFKSVFKKLPHTGVNVGESWVALQPICKTFDDVQIVEILTPVLNDPTLVRRDEAIFVYATYLAADISIKYKTNARQVFHFLIKTASDLFLFCKYASLIQKAQQHKGLSQTVRKAITLWYQQKTPSELRGFWMMHRGEHGFTHKALIKLCHVNDTTIGGTGVVKPYFQKCIEMLNEAEANGTLAEIDELLDAPEQNALDDDVMNISPELYNISEDTEITPAAMVSMSKLRRTKDKAEALKIIRKFKLRYHHVPGHLRRDSSIMELLIPTMSYLQVLKCWRYLARFNHFDNARILTLCQAKLDDERMLSRENIHPVVFLMLMHKMGVRQDMSNIPSKKVHALRMHYLHQLYKDCFGLNERCGFNMSITLNLQSNYKKKFLRNHKKLTFYDASIALAFGYFKKEPSVEVFFWTEEKNTVQKLHWTTNMRLRDAVAMCDTIKNDRNYQAIASPISYAQKEQRNYDVFVTIVPSAGRSNPKNNSESLREKIVAYRKNINPKAKLVIVNLLRFKESMRYSASLNENILEICGLDEHTPHLINNFALNRFG